MKIVILDPQAPGGRRPVPRGVVVNGRVIESPAMKRLVDSFVRRPTREVERRTRIETKDTPDQPGPSVTWDVAPVDDPLIMNGILDILFRPRPKPNAA